MAESPWIDRLTGDESARDEALAQLREILVRGLTSALATRGIDDAFAQDIAQEALIRILNSLDTFEGRSRFTTWAMSIAVRTAIGELRRRHFKDVSLDEVVGKNRQLFEIEDSSITPVDTNLDRNTLYNQLRRLIQSDLTDNQQTVIQALLGGMPVETIADRMGTNRNAVYKMMHDARTKLKRGFESSGISSEEIFGILAGGV